MRWLETITLRCTGNDQRQAALHVLEQIAEAEVAATPASLHFYRSAEVENDLSVHLKWNQDETLPCASTLGSRIAHLLREFGIIHQAVWLEERRLSHD